VVLGWRQQQEAELRAKAGPDASGVMDDRAVARFVQHHERLTRHILAEMTSRADLLVQLDENRVPLAISRSAASSR
jgi:D-glycerate 3-kinase